jgi:hypothetical protein
MERLSCKHLEGKKIRKVLSFTQNSLQKYLHCKSLINDNGENQDMSYIVRSVLEVV